MNIDPEHQDALVETAAEFGPPAPYELNPIVAEMLGPEEAEEYRRLLGVWKRNGWKTQAQVKRLFDARADFAAIEGVGEVRAPLMEQLLLLPAFLFKPVTGLEAGE
jgi:hypothetical protein